MDNGLTPSEPQVADQGEQRVLATGERRRQSSGPRERRVDNGNGNGNGNGNVDDNGNGEVIVERRKSPPRPRKSASPAVTPAVASVASETAVSDRIDPLLAASSAALDEAEAAAAKPVRRRPPARKTAAAVDDPPTTEMPVDDFFAEPTAVEARVPYVLPKIVPGEPEPEPETETETEPTEPTKSLSARVSSAFAARPQFLRPQFRGVTKQLKRSLQPVVLPRHRPRVRRVTRVVRHIDTWSVFKIALLFNIFLYAVCLTAGAMLWRVALNTGTIENIERFFESFGWQTFRLKGGEIYHNAWIIGLFGVVGLTGLAVLAATMFNLITDLVGGVRITVLEEEVVAREQRVVTWPRLIRPATPPGGKPFRERQREPQVQPTDDAAID